MSNSDVSPTDDLARDNPIPGVVNPLDLPHPGAGPVLALTRFFRNYAKFSGRASRSEYWWVAAAFAVVWIVLGGAALAAGSVGATVDEEGTSIPGVGFVPFLLLIGLVGVATIVPNIALGVRRLHDANLSGLVYLVILVPNIGSLVLLVLAILPPNAAGARFDVLRGVYANDRPSGLLSADQAYPQSAYPMQQQSPSAWSGPPSV